MLLIPPAQLSADTLSALIEDFVTREGTDNGDDTPLATRVAAVRQALDRGEALIVFDPTHQQCLLLPRHQIPAELLNEH
ncbi:YheU family protein [Pseudomonas sp. NW5]|uniref:YheU family protein n=1 Tax=Pseudomonas sp. NW5 TaxID=2934934 RepID=UPI0020206502|nr:YheU family protein [Pseudomonas sp. NW5]MCL7461606.1 YheU family protein [Pseudomonas sp. NW5]